MELGQFAELSVQFADDHFCLNEVFVGDLVEGFAPGGGEELFLFVVLHGEEVDFGLEVSFGLALDAVGGVGEDAVVFVGADE